jgi:hypothetical protein
MMCNSRQILSEPNEEGRDGRDMWHVRKKNKGKNTVLIGETKEKKIERCEYNGRMTLKRILMTKDGGCGLSSSSSEQGLVNGCNNLCAP